MEGNVSDFSNLYENVPPPPRKRLLAGFKKQNENCSDRSVGTISASPSTTPTEVGCVKNLLSYHTSGGSVNSLEEIAESSEKAAVAAVKTAEAARVVAEEKAAIAARAIATAKSALELMAVLSDRTSSSYRHAKRNTSKKQVAVHSLYTKQDEVENNKTNETEQTSHQAHFTPPSLYRYSPPSSDSKNHKHKKPKVSPVTSNAKSPNEGLLDGDLLSMCNNKVTLDTKGSSHETSTDLENEKEPQSLTKLIGSNWRVEKDIVSHRKKARKQLMCMVESQVNLS